MPPTFHPQELSRTPSLVATDSPELANMFLLKFEISSKDFGWFPEGHMGRSGCVLEPSGLAQAFFWEGAGSEAETGMGRNTQDFQDVQDSQDFRN